MTTRMLQDLGLHVGRRLDPNWEPQLFRRLNDWLLGQASATWDRPEPFDDLLAVPELRAAAAEYVRGVVLGPRGAAFFGRRSLLTPGRVAPWIGAWGWKDPRTTITLPIWLDVFPEARVLHIVRHGVDVAQSLRTRARASIARRRRRYRNHRVWATVRLRRGGFCESVRCLSVEGGFAIWDRYYQAGRRMVDELGPRALETQYEDVLERPAEQLRRLAEFSGLEASDEEIERVAATVRASRALAYRADPELRAFAERVAEPLARAGYDR